MAIIIYQGYIIEDDNNTEIPAALNRKELRHQFGISYSTLRKWLLPIIPKLSINRQTFSNKDLVLIYEHLGVPVKRIKNDN